MSTRKTLAALLAPFALLSALAVAQHAQHSEPGTVTLDAQGHSPEWEQSPHWRELYELSVAREIVGIVKDDPSVLDSYENFLVALRGPR